MTQCQGGNVKAGRGEGREVELILKRRGTAGGPFPRMFVRGDAPGGTVTPEAGARSGRDAASCVLRPAPRPPAPPTGGEPLLRHAAAAAAAVALARVRAAVRAPAGRPGAARPEPRLPERPQTRCGAGAGAARAAVAPASPELLWSLDNAGAARGLPPAGRGARRQDRH